MRRPLTLVCVALAVAVPAATSSLAASGSTPKRPIVLSGDAVGSVRFGESQEAAAASLVKMIGQSDGGVRKVSIGACIISAALYWPNFAAYFYRGKFDGYQTVNLAQGFGCETVAEGVEDAEVLTLLREFEVDYAQGFHLGRPAPL